MKTFKDFGLRVRKDLDRNYYSLWMGLKTYRMDLGPEIKLPYGESEFFDIGITERCNACCPFCVTGDTKIKTPGGYKSISDIKPGDKVLSFNESTRQSEYKQVVDTSEREYSGDLIEIETESGKIIQLTPNHKVYTQRGYIMAENLLETDVILDE